jgi:hypothetical protein
MSVPPAVVSVSHRIEENRLPQSADKPYDARLAVNDTMALNAVKATASSRTLTSLSRSGQHLFRKLINHGFSILRVFAARTFSPISFIGGTESLLFCASAIKRQKPEAHSVDRCHLDLPSAESLDDGLLAQSITCLPYRIDHISPSTKQENVPTAPWNALHPFPAAFDHIRGLLGNSISCTLESAQLAAIRVLHERRQNLSLPTWRATRESWAMPTCR